MPGERYVDKAVEKLAAFIAANLPTQLRAVETAQSLAASSLEDPVAVLNHRAPFDNRSPLVEVFEERWDFVDLNNKILAADLTVAFTFIGGPDLGEGEKTLRRYATALIDCITANPTLGGEVIVAMLTDGSSAVGRGDNSSTKFVFTQGVEVHVKG